jgi:hypothetical protein
VCVSLALPPFFSFFFITLFPAAPAAISAHIVFCRNSVHGSVFFSLRGNYIFALRSSSSTAMAAALASTSSVASAATCFVQKSFPSSCSQRSVARPVVGKHSSLIFLLHCQVPVFPHLPDLPPATGSSTSSGRPWSLLLLQVPVTPQFPDLFCCRLFQFLRSLGPWFFSALEFWFSCCSS